jgi:hypothetical protein
MTVTVSTKKAIKPQGPTYSGLTVTDCSAPTGDGSTKIAPTKKSCAYAAGQDLADAGAERRPVQAHRPVPPRRPDLDLDR